MNISWSDLFLPQQGLLAMFVRGTVIYWFVFLLLRMAGRREVGSLGVADLIVLLLVADAAGSSMSGDSDALLDGMTVVVTLVSWSFLADRAAYYFPVLRRVLESDRVCLVKDGRIQRSGMRSEFITRAELLEALRLKGIDDLTQVRRAYMESTGEISVIKRNAPHGSPGHSTLPPET